MCCSSVQLPPWRRAYRRCWRGESAYWSYRFSAVRLERRVTSRGPPAGQLDERIDAGHEQRRDRDVHPHASSPRAGRADSSVSSRYPAGLRPTPGRRVLCITLWIPRWTATPGGGQHPGTCGCHVDVRRILKLMAGNPCAPAGRRSRNSFTAEAEVFSGGNSREGGGNPGTLERPGNRYFPRCRPGKRQTV